MYKTIPKRANKIKTVQSKSSHKCLVPQSEVPRLATNSEQLLRKLNSENNLDDEPCLGMGNGQIKPGGSPAIVRTSMRSTTAGSPTRAASETSTTC
jgi:hypothetical protein